MPGTLAWWLHPLLFSYDPLGAGVLSGLDAPQAKIHSLVGRGEEKGGSATLPSLRSACVLPYSVVVAH